jgi:hypothetical protein
MATLWGGCRTACLAPNLGDLLTLLQHGAQPTVCCIMPWQVDSMERNRHSPNTVVSTASFAACDTGSITSYRCSVYKVISDVLTLDARAPCLTCTIAVVQQLLSNAQHAVHLLQHSSLHAMRPFCCVPKTPSANLAYLAGCCECTTPENLHLPYSFLQHKQHK